MHLRLFYHYPQERTYKDDGGLHLSARGEQGSHQLLPLPHVLRGQGRRTVIHSFIQVFFC